MVDPIPPSIEPPPPPCAGAGGGAWLTASIHKKTINEFLHFPFRVWRNITLNFLQARTA